MFMEECECLTQKCVDFIATPMGGKTIEEVPGIGKVYGCRLRKAGLCKVIILYSLLLPLLNVTMLTSRYI